MGLWHCGTVGLRTGERPFNELEQRQHEQTNEPTKAAGNKQKVAKRKGGKKRKNRQRKRERKSGRGADSCLKCFAQFGPQQQQQQ